jgi:hypothetical protein
VTFANAGGVSEFSSMSFSANTNVTLSDCTCSAETEGGSGSEAGFHDRWRRRPR